MDVNVRKSVIAAAKADGEGEDWVGRKGDVRRGRGAYMKCEGGTSEEMQLRKI